MSSRARRALGDSVPAVLVGLLVFQLARTHLAERYRVTSRSMEPTLHGDRDDGDIVLVDRTAWWFGAPRTWDLVVVRNRDEPDRNHLVKRLLAVGPRWIQLVGGDVFEGADRHHLERVVKHPVVHRSMRMTHAEFVAGRDTRAELLHEDPARWLLGEGGIVLRPAESLAALRAETTAGAQDRRAAAEPPDPYLPLHLSLAGPVGPAFEDAVGARIASGGPPPRDIGLELSLELEPGVDALQLVYEYAEAYFAVALDVRSGELGYAFYGEPRARAAVAPPGAGPLELEFGLLDGRLFVVLDGALVWSEPVELPRESRLVLERADRFPNLLHLGIAGTGRARIRRLRVFRDPHYEAGVVREPYFVEPGRIFVAGDNAFDSSDSRDRLADPFELGDLIGRPCAVIGPRGRLRALPRYPAPPDRLNR